MRRIWARPHGRAASDPRRHRSLLGEMPAASRAAVAPLRALGASLRGRRVLITSGPDPGADRSCALYRQPLLRQAGPCFGARRRGARRRGDADQRPRALCPIPQGVTVVKVETAHEMLAATLAALPADIAICAAAVADWRAADEAPHKLKKQNQVEAELKLALNPDILATIAKPGPKRPRLVIGFAAETENLIENATAKRRAKGADWIVANDVWPGTGAMGGDDTQVHLVTGSRRRGLAARSARTRPRSVSLRARRTRCPPCARPLNERHGPREAAPAWRGPAASVLSVETCRRPRCGGRRAPESSPSSSSPAPAR